MMKYLFRYKSIEKVLNNPGEVRDNIFLYTADVETAINVENWCEISKLNDSYNGRDFDLLIIGS